MTAFFWSIDDNLVHHIRAESAADVRARIAAIHGEDVAQRAVVQVVRARHVPESAQTSACA